MQTRNAIVLALGIVLFMIVVIGGVSHCQIEIGKQLNACVDKTNDPLKCEAAFKSLEQ